MAEPSETTAPPFGSSYAKARKAYGLSSALLLAWELVGIEIDAKPIENLKISLKSPQAAPYVLIALVVYFTFRFTIEWYQAAPARRRLRASRLDFAAAHTIGGAAIALYAIQAFFRVQVADKIPAGAFAQLWVGSMVAVLLITLLDITVALRPSFLLVQRANLVKTLVALSLALIALGYTTRVTTLLYFGLGGLGGLALVGPGDFLRYRVRAPLPGGDRTD